MSSGVLKTSKCMRCPSTDEWIKMIHTHVHAMEYNTAIKKNEILPFVTTWMDLEGITLSEISHRKINAI